MPYAILAVPLLLMIYSPVFAGVVLGGVLLFLVGLAVRNTGRRRLEEREAAEVRASELALDADEQHRAFLDGDAYGLYGHFMPSRETLD